MAKTNAERKQDSDSRSREIPFYLIAAFFILFLVLFYYVAAGGKQPPTAANVTGDVDLFRQSLESADQLGIVMNVSGLNVSASRYVYACGAGLAGSWGKIGRNISNLHVYVLDNDECTTSRPLTAEDFSGNESVNTTIIKTSSECLADNSGRLSFEVRYGPGYTIFTEKTAYLFVDENFDAECSFNLKQEGGVPVISGDEITGTINGTENAGTPSNSS